jgi:hypothetical protein
MRLIGLSARAALIIPATAAAVVLLTAGTAYANVAVTQVSNDPYTDAQAQHQTEVEPDTFQFGNTIVSAFQVGRVFGGGSSNIGWATSTNGGATWTNGFLPGITTNAGGTYLQCSDPAVAFDAQDNVWLISSLGLTANGADVLTSRSTNGGLTWGNPIVTATGVLDKNWIVCDNTVERAVLRQLLHAVRHHQRQPDPHEDLTKGGLIWGPASRPAAAPRPGGSRWCDQRHRLVPTRATNAGADPLVPLHRRRRELAGHRARLDISHHTVAGCAARVALPSAEIDSAGTVYVAWADCRFRSRLHPKRHHLQRVDQRDHVGAAPYRVPIDATGQYGRALHSGIGVDKSTSGNTARIGVTYYFYPNSSCTAATCQLNVGFISSTNGGNSWSAPTQIAGPMTLAWLPNTSQGRMFGDYISTSVLAGGNAYPVIPIASAPTGSTFHVPMFVPTGGMAISSGALQSVKWTGPEPPGQSEIPPQPHR